MTYLIAELWPRCGNADAISYYRLPSFKWNKTETTLHHYLASEQVIELTKTAFTLWTNTSAYVLSMMKSILLLLSQTNA